MACCDHSNASATEAKSCCGKPNCCCKSKCWIKYLIAAIVGFGIITFYEMMVHGHLLIDMYKQTPQLWRPEAEMKAFCPYILISHFIAALLITGLACVHKKCGGPRCFVIGLALLIALYQGMSYFWMPISATLAGMWFLSSFVETLLVFTAVYLILNGGKCWTKGASGTCGTEGSCKS